MDEGAKPPARAPRSRLGDHGAEQEEVAPTLPRAVLDRFCGDHL
jgi:hypothetical protein